MKKYLLAGACALLSTHVSAQELFNKTEVGQTENAVITNDGRYFAATTLGLIEVSKNANGSLSKSVVMPTQINGQDCLLTGLTTDGVTLYGSCTVGVSTYGAPQAAELFKISINGDQLTLDRYAYPTPIWFNGMAIDGSGNLYMSNSNAGYGKAVIVKTPLPTSQSGSLVLQDWLIASGSEKLPNGIQIEGNKLYYSTGGALQEIAINADGSAGTPVEKYKVSSYFGLIDDFVITPDHIAVTEVQQYSWGGTNKIVLVDKAESVSASAGFTWCWWNCGGGSTDQPETIDTGSIRLSSLVYDANGDVFAAGSLVGTSWFEGGIHQFDYQ